jgi:DNA replication protein DnaC
LWYVKNENDLIYIKINQCTLSIKNARFRYQASLQEINFTEGRNLTKETITALSDCSFIDRGENIIITGATGCGKSFLASAIGYQACSLNKKVA